jgi:general secretion pathway protein D
MNMSIELRERTRPVWRLLALGCVAVLSALLVGCAAQTAFREANSLQAEGKALPALTKYEEASRLDPSSAEYRIAYLQARDRYVQAMIERADAAARSGQYEAAESAYREVLTVPSQRDRALTGLRQLDQFRRWDAAIKTADQAIERKDWEEARVKLRSVLSENPRNDAANKRMQHIDEQTAKPAIQPSLAAAYKLPVSLEFKEASLRTIFEVISRTAKLNFLFDKEVKTDQRTSIYLRNSTVEAAVNWLLLTNQLEQRVLDGNSVLIYPATPAKQREYQPLTVKSFYLSNADAKSVAATIKTVLKTKDVVVDEKINLVIMRDSPEAIRMAEKLVALHDVAEPEVMLEVEILEVKRGRLLDLGVRWPDQATLTLLPSRTGGTLTLEDLRNTSRSSVGVATTPMTITAKKQDSDTNILANPRIRARNHEKAKILIGERVPNITTTSTATGFLAESVNYVDVGLKLEVEPTIYLDNEVAIKVALEVSSIISQQQTKAGSLAYQLGTRTAQTVLRLKDGENQVLAGLINDEERRTANKVPGVGELPVVGRLFGGQADDSSKTEIVLSITPRVLRNVQRPDAGTLEFESGTEASLRSWPSEAGGATESAGPAAAPAGSTERTNSRPTPPSSIQQPAAAPATPTVTSTSGTIVGLTQLRWEGPTQVTAGDTFSVQLSMQSEQPVAAVPLVIGFDPKVLQLVAVTEGGFLKDGGASTVFSQRVDANGQITITATRADKATGATSPGVVATLTMKAISTSSATETALRALNVTPKGLAGQVIAVPLPAPHSLTLVR